MSSLGISRARAQIFFAALLALNLHLAAAAAGSDAPSAKGDAPAASDAPPAKAAANAPADPEAAALFAKRCSGCHGDDGRGHTNRPNVHVPDFHNPEWQNGHDEAAIRSIVANGVEGRHMPAFKNRLSAEQIASIAALVHSFKP